MNSENRVVRLLSWLNPFRTTSMLVGAIVGPGVGYFVALWSGGTDRAIFVSCVWGGIAGLFITHVLRIEQGRLVVDKVALSYWLKGDPDERERLANAAHATTSALRRNRRVAGNVMLVLGVGTIAAFFPGAFRYPGGYESVILAVGAMGVMCGWLLRSNQ